MTAEEIRAQAIAVVVEYLKPVTYRCCDECESAMSPELMVDGYVDPAALADALAAAGLLPVGAEYRSAYEPDGTPLGYVERQLLTEWRKVDQ